MSPRSAFAFSLLLLSPTFLGAAPSVAGPSAAATSVVEGTASIAWGDPAPGTGRAGPLSLTVRDDAGRDHVFTLPAGSPAADFDPGADPGPPRARALRSGPRPRRRTDRGARARAGPAGRPRPDRSPALDLADVQVRGRRHRAAHSGVLHPDVRQRPGRLDHYWRELSYNLIDVVGSTAYGWVVLPQQSRPTYVPTPGSGCLDGDPDNDADLDLLFADCTAVADPFVDFSNGGTGGFVGINLMFNSDLDGCAWGGGHQATLDGVSKNWRTTWEPPWGYQNVSVMAHEMGHGFGLPHSNNWDNDGDPYDNSWDVMSDAWNYEGTDPTYGTIGKHTIAYHKNLLAWFTPDEVWTPPANGVYTIEIGNHALAIASGYRMAKLPIPSTTRYWTLETRDRTGLYDGHLPGHAVIVHEIYASRPEDAWCYDAGNPPGNYCNSVNTMWTVGETFTDPVAGRQIAFRVDAATADGFAVTIWYGVPPNTLFLDGFESSDTSRWSATVP